MEGITETFTINDFRELQRQLRKPVHIKKPRKYLRNHPKQASKKKRKHLPSIRSLIKKADRVFSEFIRKRDKRCVLCGSTTIQCGHLFKRGKHSVRFDELNCNALCPSCNFKDNFEHEHYINWFLRKHGLHVFEMLYEKSMILHKFTRVELNEIIEKYGTE